MIGVYHMLNRIFYLVICLLPFYSSGQGALTFHTRFGNPDDEVANAVIQTRNKDYLVVGQSSGLYSQQTDIFFARTDSMGVPRWERRLGGPMQDVAKAVWELPDSTILIAGFTNSYGSGGYDATLWKTDKNGNVIWHTEIGGTDWDYGHSIVVVASGDIYVCGETYSFGNDKQAFVSLVNPSGVAVWTKVFGGLADDTFNQIVSLNSSSLVAFGSSSSYTDQDGDYWMQFLSLAGDSLSAHFFGSTKAEIGRAIVISREGDFYIGGASDSLNDGNWNAHFYRLTNTLQLVYERFYGQGENDEGIYQMINACPSCTSVVFCHRTDQQAFFGFDSKALLMTDGGYYKNGGRVGSTEDDVGYALTNCSDNGYLMAGFTKGFGASGKDIFLVKFDSLMNGPGPFVTEVEEFPQNDLFLEMFPNPFFHQLNLRVSDVDMTLIIRDCLGREVLCQKFMGPRQQISLEVDFPAGLYTAELRADKRAIFRKLVCSAGN